MRRYLRARTLGASYFFTVNLENRVESRLLVDRIDSLRDAFMRVKRDRPFEVDAIVILPEHLHAVWTLPPDDADYSTRWGRIKAFFSMSIERTESVNASRLRKRERGIWQRRFFEHQIRDDRDLAAHVDYIHRNPVKHGWVRRVADWPYSSFHRYVREGVLAPDWGGEAGDSGSAGRFGEAE
jgi:putative transposase